MSASKDRNITNLYDTLLDKVLGNVVMAFATGSASQAWDSLLTLRDILPAEIKSEIQGLIDQTETFITVQLRQRNYTQTDGLFRKMFLEKYVADKKHGLFDEIVRLLQKYGFLQRSFPSPRYDHPQKPLGTGEE
ncbi:hypothetical protein MUO79_07000 [Candidatus Bathyarchaeota archaeon]|nr:hypothetical protein [Candidatus Bathyarchaeota archaeon]